MNSKTIIIPNTGLRNNFARHSKSSCISTRLGRSYSRTPSIDDTVLRLRRHHIREAPSYPRCNIIHNDLTGPFLQAKKIGRGGLDRLIAV